LDSADDDVYNKVTDEEHRKLARARQEREDYVVDDEELGYADDGEFIMYKADDLTAKPAAH
jgi:DNA polymerase alpha subunit p180 N terminal